jgi:hypothetical protein
MVNKPPRGRSSASEEDAEAEDVASDEMPEGEKGSDDAATEDTDEKAEE